MRSPGVDILLRDDGKDLLSKGRATEVYPFVTLPLSRIGCGHFPS